VKARTLRVSTNTRPATAAAAFLLPSTSDELPTAACRLQAVIMSDIVKARFNEREELVISSKVARDYTISSRKLPRQTVLHGCACSVIDEATDIASLRRALVDDEVAVSR
jgi:hypothetical protein